MRKPRFVLIAILFLLLSTTAFGQADIVKSEGITSPLHQVNLGKIAFTAKSIPVESLKETDFLKTFELHETGDLAIRAFMANSLTNYLHRLAPELSVDELTRKGNYQFSFFVDGVLIHKENLHPAWIPAENKRTKTVFSASFINSANPESRWGAIWHVFLLNGGEQALSAGKHLLRLEMRPFLKTTELKVGELIATGELQLTVIKPKVDEKLTAIQPIQAASGWQISKDTYDKEKIRELKRVIAENLYKEIKSIVVIKNGELLIEEYFNGATRDTLHNTRSVGKSFASTMMGIAINEGYIKSENQTLKDFYDLSKFANHSAKKESVTLKSLLTMSSGFNGNDDDESSPGNEEKMYPTDNWVKFALDLPMDDKKQVGKTWNYFTAGVILLGGILHKSVPDGLETYADKKLFKPLGITKYQWQYTPQKVANTAGGLQMSALDFAKFGQLYKNGGRWNGKQIIPRDWVDKSFTKHLELPDGGFYGYLFWNTTFNVGSKQHEAFYSTGNGGNKIYILKDQPLVIVITATAYGKWYMHRQVNNMMERYILPAVIN
ncbi:MAG TPA: serine hydrolase [Pyrinomonadaceae bacterium]|jgi:CubicO group peptidase (beta-lactamase class C family)